MNPAPAKGTSVVWWGQQQPRDLPKWVDRSSPFLEIVPCPSYQANKDRFMSGLKVEPSTGDATPSTTGQFKMATGASGGKDPTPDTVREGSVRMEQHPQYEETIGQVEAAEFEIKIGKEARVEIKEVVDLNGNLIRVEKTLYVIENMRYLDLEHELGHIKQLERFGKNVPPHYRVIEQPDGNLTNAPNQQGIFTAWQDTITEYHNRIDEFLRLYQRSASPELLKEHAEGVKEWYQKYWTKGIKGGRSPSQKQWAETYFPDIAELQARYREAIKTIK